MEVTQMLKATGEIGVGWFTELCNQIVKEWCIPEDWKSSLLIVCFTPVYKGKGSCTGSELLEHATDVVERVLDYRIWQQVKIDNMQFGYKCMLGKATTDAIFVIRQLREKCRAKG